MNPQPASPTDPFAAIPATPDIQKQPQFQQPAVVNQQRNPHTLSSTVATEIKPAAVPVITPSVAASPTPMAAPPTVQPLQSPPPTVHEIDLFAPPTTAANTTLQQPFSPTQGPQPVQPSQTEYWPQPHLTADEQESLFGRERLTKTHKIVISIITVIVLGALIGGGLWLYYTMVANPKNTVTNTTTETAKPPVQKNTNNTNTVTPPVQNTTNTSTLDTDNDGLTDDAERRLGTNPQNKDTDGDSYIDGEEVQHGYSPLE